MADTYCDIAPAHEWHGPYHDREYDFPEWVKLFKKTFRFTDRSILKQRPAWSRQHVPTRP